MEEWRLHEKLVGITINNGRNMVSAVEKLSWLRIPCFAHTLQIAVKPGLSVPFVSQLKE